MPYKFCVTVLIGWLLVINICNHADASEFGPFRGKIVDAETKEPIEGVVVLIEWHQIHFFAGSTFIDAQETLTDKNGEFYIPGIWVLNPWRHFSVDSELVLFKSGYKAIQTGAWRNWKEFKPTLEYILKIEDEKPVILLKKLTVEERKQYSEPSVSYKVPCEKWKLLREEINKENRFRGVGEERCNN